MTSITRRSLTLGLGASAALAAASPPIVADAAGQRAVLPSVASCKIGAVQVTAVSDGFIDVPFDVFTGAPVSEIEAAFAARFSRPSTGMHRLGFTVWLVDDGDRLVLIDTGYASMGGPTTGRLLAALAALGVPPEAVSAVLITHMHADHISGLVADGRPQRHPLSVSGLLFIRERILHAGQATSEKCQDVWPGRAVQDVSRAWTFTSQTTSLRRIRSVPIQLP